MTAQGIEERRGDIVPGDFGTEGCWIAEESEDIGIGEKAAQRVQHLLAAAAIEKPIMYNGATHVNPAYA